MQYMFTIPRHVRLLFHVSFYKHFFRFDNVPIAREDWPKCLGVIHAQGKEQEFQDFMLHNVWSFQVRSAVLQLAKGVNGSVHRIQLLIDRDTGLPAAVSTGESVRFNVNSLSQFWKRDRDNDDDENRLPMQKA